MACIIQVMKVYTNAKLLVLFPNKDNACYPHWIFDLMNESCFIQLVDFNFDLRNKLWSKMSLPLLNRSVPLFDYEMMDCHFWIDFWHLLVRPSKDVPILGEQTCVLILLFTRERCINESFLWFLYCTKVHLF